MSGMPETSAPRPAQVTIAAGLVMLGSVVLVLVAFDLVAGLRSLETRESVADFLSEQPGADLGLDLQEALTLLRTLTMVAAACATTTAILAFSVLRRSRSARLGLTLLAPPLFLAGLAASELRPTEAPLSPLGFLSAVVVGSVVMLWLQPARDWVDGKAPRPAPDRPEPRPRPTPDPGHEPTPEPAPAGRREARAYQGFGDPGSPPAYVAPPTAPPAMLPTAPTTALPTAPPRPARPARPAALMWACGLTWAGTALVALVMLIAVALVLVAPDMFVDEAYRQNPDLRADTSPAELRSSVIVAGTVLVCWCVTAALLGALVWRGRQWASTALLASACCASVLCLAVAVVSPLLLPSLALCAPVVPLLLKPEVRAFLAHR